MPKHSLRGVLAFSLLLSFLAVSATSGMENTDVRVLGFGLKDSVDVDGPVVVRFELVAQSPITDVLLSYVDVKEEWANSSMRLVEGDTYNGWWEATIQLKMIEQKTEISTLRYIPNPMKLYVSLPQGTVELEIPQDYFPMSAWQTGRGPADIKPFITILPLIIAGLCAVGIIILSKRFS